MRPTTRISSSYITAAPPPSRWLGGRCSMRVPLAPRGQAPRSPEPSVRGNTTSWRWARRARRDRPCPRRTPPAERPWRPRRVRWPWSTAPRHSPGRIRSVPPDCRIWWATAPRQTVMREAGRRRPPRPVRPFCGPGEARLTRIITPRIFPRARPIPETVRVWPPLP